MSEARKKLLEEIGREPAISAIRLMEAKRHGLTVRRAQPFSLSAREQPMYTVDHHLVRITDITGATVTELEHELAEVGKQEEQLKVKTKAKKEEYKRLINREIGTLNAMAKDEDEAANRYRSASNYSPLPTMKKLLLVIGAEEQAHAQRLRMLATELERGIL